MKCSYCGSSRIIERDGEYVCMDCGTVLGPVYVFDTYTQSSPLIDSEEVDLTPIWKSIERKVHDESTKVSLYKRLRVIHEQFRIRSSKSSLQRALDCIKSMARNLGISNEYVEEAKSILLKIIGLNDQEYTYYHAAAAAMLYVILTRGLPVSTKDVISLCRSLGHKVNFESIRIVLIKLGGVKYDVHKRIEAHIRMGLIKLFGDNWVTLYPKAMNILNNLNKFVIQSKNPITLAAAIIYCVSKESGYRIKIENVASTLSVSPFTMRDYVKKYLNC